MPVIYAPGRSSGNRAMLPETVRAALYVYSRNNADFMKVRRLTTSGSTTAKATRGVFPAKWAAYDVLAWWPVRQRSTATPRMGSTFRRRSSRFLSSPDREHRNSDGLDLHRRQARRALRTNLVRRRLQEQPLLFLLA